MCGIAGILSSDIDLRGKKLLVEKMGKTLKKRGPDAAGLYLTPEVALVHRRLSVIDVENGAQPMHFGKYVIVYNGEIYNTDEVRNELEGFGYKFDTHCDTEVVLKAYDKWGNESVKKLNGIFAYAIYDKKENSLFACRDRIGVKPFFYNKTKNTFSFASKIDTLLCQPYVKSAVDEEGLYEIFMLGPAKTIGKAIFKDICELPPAFCLTYKNGEIKTYPYWKLEAKEFDENEETAAEHTYLLVKDSIERQLVSDVPLATFLSGGLDSSIISKIASDKYKESGKTLDTYSVDYTDNDKYFKKSLFQPNKDSDYIDVISSYIGSNHHNIVLNNVDVANALDEAVIERGVPGFVDIDSSLMLFCKEVKKDFTVCLSGECADEIFAGYPWYHKKEILFENVFPWARNTNIRQRILKNGFLSDGEEYLQSAYKNTLKNISYLENDDKINKRMREMFVLNLNWFMQTLLARKDNMSMASSLEVRVPFCDYRLVEYAYNMPWNIKALDGREKGILRKAFENDLPKEIAWRKKSPYPKTHNPAYFARVKELLAIALTDKSTPLMDWIDIDNLYLLLQNPDSLPEPWYGQLMGIPQIAAYIYQIYAWIKHYNVEFEI
ncbi:MAG: asparagine synthase (glutamine-hydrolyzing) [Eubacterium sp.]|nr:asparagine synthase (glutamine-hydrolyzing) [Eubacterium sp.]